MNTEPEKVIKGMEMHASGFCIEFTTNGKEYCPYWENDDNCMAQLLEDALYLMKAREPGWISVKDRLPKTDEGHYSRKTYIVSTVRNNVLAMEYVSKTIRGKAVKRWEWNDRISPWEVTHWMPLPKPQKERNGGKDEGQNEKGDSSL